MKRICALITLSALALGQNCDVSNLLPLSNGSLTSQPADNGGAADRRRPGINANPSGSPRPEVGAEVTIVVVSQSRQDADVVVRYLVGSTEVRRTELHVPARATLPPIGPDLAVVVAITGKHANGVALPQTTLQLGQQFEAGDIREFVIIDPDDLCPSDPAKYEPGQCGCGVADTDTDGDGLPDCIDACPGNATRAAPGSCGCDHGDTDADGDGKPDCRDSCPQDPQKTAPGACGCGQPDTDTDGDRTPDCLDQCPEDPNKTQPGLCGCGVVDGYVIAGTGSTFGCPVVCTDPALDTDGDSVADCYDGCPLDMYKTSPGACGCGAWDSDYDEDGTPDCIDGCPNSYIKTAPGQCGCDQPDTDTDGDSEPDCTDGCPLDASKTAPGLCGCGISDMDSDGDGALDCNDGCPADPLKTSPGVCGCGTEDVDTDADSIPDCIDGCPTDQTKTSPGDCGCNVPEGTCAIAQACCLGSVDCSDLPPDECLASYGTPQGADTTCATTMCYITPPLEACCMSSTCTEMPIGQCSAYGGLPYGPGSTCAMAPCYTPPVACCLAGTCTEMPEDMCLLSGGASNGPGSTCGTVSCGPATQACCLGTSCADMPLETCLSSSGTPMGTGTSCLSADCVSPISLGVFWSTSAGDIHMTLTDNSMTTTIVTGEASIQSLHFSYADMRLYWLSNGLIRTSQPDGSDLRTLPVVPFGTPGGLATDVPTHTLLWTELADPDVFTVYSTPLDVPGEPTMMYNTGGALAAGAIGATYYTQPRIFFGFYTSPMNTLRFQPSAPDLSKEYNCTDPAARVVSITDFPGMPFVFWAETNNDTFSWIRRGAGDGTPPVTIVTRPEIIQSLAFCPINATLYWTVPAQGAINFSSIGGGSVQTFLSGVTGVQEVTIGPIPAY